MSSGFVTETELAEARQKRQEEWEKVRQPDEPLGKTHSQFYLIFSSDEWLPNDRMILSKKTEIFSFRQLLTEMPEEPYDGRTLYDRLKEQRDKKDLEFEESHKLSKLKVVFNVPLRF